MKAITITSVYELLSNLKEQTAGVTMYRGQANASWDLIPSIGRLYDKTDHYENWTTFQDELLGEFKKYSLPFLGKIPVSFLEWLIIAQHYGLPTSLLDWTTNPLKGLFFAVENPSSDVDAAVWALTPEEWTNDITPLLDAGTKCFDAFFAFHPPYVDTRVMAQESCFTMFPLNMSPNPIPPLNDKNYYKEDISELLKFIIPKGKKEELRLELQMLGVTHMSLFPGLEGITRNIRRGFNLP